MQNQLQLLQDVCNQLARNPYFVEIESVKRKFNVFLATDMQSREIKHTKFLGYLLDPNESHSFGDEYLIGFLQSLPTPAIGEIRLLDMQTSYAKVTTEKKLKHLEENAQLDLVIEIPSIQDAHKSHVFIIENKIKARQAKEQLIRYRRCASEIYKEKSTSLNFYYLNIADEEPDDDAWVSMLYSESVVPALKSLLKYSSETMSEYLKNVINDYIELVVSEDEESNICEALASKIDHSLLEKVSLSFGWANKNTYPLEYLRLETKYPRALKFINDYDKDQRIKLSSYYRGLFNGGRGNETLLNTEGHKLYFKNASLKYLEFNFLDDKNIKILQRIGCRGLYFQFRVEEKKSVFDVGLHLVLTQIDGAGQKYRQGIFDCIFQSINREKNKKDVSAGQYSGFPLKKYRLKDASLEESKIWVTNTLNEIARITLVEQINSDLSSYFSANGLA